MPSSKPRIQTCLYRGVELMAIKNQTLTMLPGEDADCMQMQHSMEEQHKQMMMALLNGDYAPGDSLTLPEVPFAEEFSADPLCFPNENNPVFPLSSEVLADTDSSLELDLDLFRKEPFQPLLKETPTTLADFQEYLEALEVQEEESLQKTYRNQLRNKWLRSMITGKPQEARELIEENPEAFADEHNWCFTVVDIDEELASSGNWTQYDEGKEAE